MLEKECFCLPFVFSGLNELKLTKEAKRQLNLTQIQEKEHSPTPQQHHPKQNKRRQKTEHAPCSASTGPCPRSSRKDKPIEASIAHHGAVPSEHGGVAKVLQSH
ncbi:hypothetical protein HanPI659440_Chr15g0586201 [Helianthus annuus]|nr:hypothetical protein HanPI659440_Chr15g0586201 [Helianthus annuus]